MIVNILSTIHREAPYFLPVAVALTLVLGLFEGMGAVLILPILQTLGPTQDVTMPAPMQTAMDYVGLTPEFLPLLSVLVAVMAIKAVALFWQRFFGQRVSVGYERRLKSGIFEHLLLSEWKHAIKSSSGHVMNTFLVESQRAMRVFVEFSEGAATLVFIVAYALVAVWLAPLSFLFSIVAGLMVAAVYMVVARKVQRLGESLTGLNYDAQHYFSDSLHGLKYIKSTAIGRRVIARYYELVRAVERLIHVLRLSAPECAFMGAAARSKALADYGTARNDGRFPASLTPCHERNDVGPNPMYQPTKDRRSNRFPITLLREDLRRPRQGRRPYEA